MRLTNSFAVSAPVDTLWEVLNDVERFAQYIPGFELTEADGDRYRGQMKVKVGAVTVQYDVDVTVLERNEASRTVRAVAAGRERRGSGTMKATVTGTLTGDAEGSAATMDTDLSVTGRVAQFGRNIIAEVAGKLMTQFADDLERHVLAPPPVTGGPSDTAIPAAAAPAQGPGQAGEPLDLLAAAGGPLAKRIIPLAFALGLLWAGFAAVRATLRTGRCGER